MGKFFVPISLDNICKTSEDEKSPAYTDYKRKESYSPFSPLFINAHIFLGPEITKVWHFHHFCFDFSTVPAMPAHSVLYLP